MAMGLLLFGWEHFYISDSLVHQTDVFCLLRLVPQISHMFRCARIQGLDTAEGLLLFGREHFYIIDGFTLLRTKEIKDIDSLPYE